MQINTVCLWEIDLALLHVIIIRKKSYSLVCTVQWAGLLAMENQNLFLAKVYTQSGHDLSITCFHAELLSGN